MAPIANATEEETLPDYELEQFYPVHIGEIIKSPTTGYKIIGKLGYGRYSTVWLCLELSDNTFYTIKIGTKHNGGRREAEIYEHIQTLGSQHLGCKHVRELHEAFELPGPHYCLVHDPLAMSADEFQETFPDSQYPPIILKPLIRCLLMALDSLHSEAGVIHTDIQARNILLGLGSASPVLDFVAAEIEHPSVRKVIDERRSIYSSRALPNTFPPGHPILCDFGHAMKGSPGEKHTGVIQPLPYRAPEVILGIEWGAEADIWNLGALTWQLAFGCQLFTGTTEEEQLAAMIACLGTPPADFVQRCREEGEGARYFDEDGVWSGKEITPNPIDDILEGPEVEAFVDLLKGMLAWVPEERQTAADLKRHAWMHSG
ncbi:hypothetical protein V501_01203 [Pseudogymnoascus sp. VKM F-4519 (FW-2642)]|nr:hypothetical protein V501_01203 [Pseudogymnoascus sp. VKM F-4519 (FW-2642)]